MKRSQTIIALFGATALAIGLNHARSQQPPTASPFATPPTMPAPASAVRITNAGNASPMAKLRSQKNTLLKALRDNKDGSKRNELISQLEPVLSTEFDEDMKVRETDIAALEERIKNLREQMERRRRSKKDIVELQVKVLVNEADGLGYSSRSTPNMPAPVPASMRLSIEDGLFDETTRMLGPGSEPAIDDLFRPSPEPTAIRGRD